MAMDRLYGYILTFILIAVLLGVGLLVLDEFSGTLDSGSAAQTAVNETIDALADFPTWFAVIVVVISAAVILSIVIRAFRGGGM